MKKIYLTNTCAGPQGSYLGEREYVVPGQMPADLAAALVETGAGRWVAGPPEPPSQPEAKLEAAVEAEPEESAAERTEPVKRALPPWTMKVSPADYLARYPEGPNAPLAQLHVEHGGGDAG